MDNASVGIVAAGLVAHQIFKRFEPNTLPAHFALLSLTPTLLSVLFWGQRSLLGSLLASFVIYLSTLTLSTVLYRVSPFHPLARYPGPLSHKISKWPLTWIASKGIQHKHIQSLHERYGDVVRTGPNELSFRDPDTLVGINTLPKGPRWINATMMYSNQNSLIAEQVTQEHARRRKPWNRAFNTVALKGYEDVVAKRVTELADGLAAQNSDVDLGKWIGYFSFDFMSDMAFGGGSEMLRDGDKGSNWHVLNDGMAAFHIIGQVPWAALYARRIPAMGRMIQAMYRQGIAMATQRLKAGALRHDLFYYLSNEDGAEPEAPPLREIISNGTLAMVAGSDTTSIALSNLFYFVLRDGDAYKRLQAEVDSFFPPGESAMDTRKHAIMPYLNAVINETLRLVPIVPDGSQRRVHKGSGGRAAGQYYIPEETVTYVHYYSLHRDPRQFSPATDSFWPDRWLMAADEKLSRPEGFVHNADAFVPFSFGPSNCVGKGLAMLEMRMLVSHLFQRFELSFPKGWDVQQYEDGLEDWFTIQKPELKVVLTPRQA